jgi:TetR/AcrR family transcriptional regulator, acrAB operon repressor
MARRTKAEAEQTRAAVLAAAIEVFLDRGVTRATFDEIARAAGVTRGAIYWHFKDKQEIFRVLERRANLPNEEFGDRLKARLAADPGLDPLDELAASLREGLLSFEANIERRRILTILWQRCEYVGEMSPALERQQRADAALRDLFEAVIGSATERGLVVPGWPPELAAYALLLLINGSVADWLRKPNGARLVTRTMPLVTALLGSIRVPVTADAKSRKGRLGRPVDGSRVASRR